MLADEHFLELLPHALTRWVKRSSASKTYSHLLPRIWDHDYTLWSDSPAEISNRLGWLELPEAMPAHIQEMDEVCRQVRADGYTTALLLGMGGSSLAPEVFSKVFGTGAGFLNLSVLDSTDPLAIQAAAQRLDLERTLFIVSTKSGGTVETLSLFKYFFNLVSEHLGEMNAGKHFIAITDPGSSLQTLAVQFKFRHVFLNDPNLGGRYSALSHFGLLPAALIGVDSETLLRSAAGAAAQNGPSIDPRNSPAVQLGLFLSKASKSGIDKLTFVSDPALESFEDWVEQLVAESTGKNGKGLLPVAHEAVPEKISSYSRDRIFVLTQLGPNAELDSLAGRLNAAGYPCTRLRLEEKADLGKLIFTWEMAVAIAGVDLGIQPFDQPNVESAKELARKQVSAYQESGKLSGGELESLSLPALYEFLGKMETGGYLSLQAYIPPSETSSVSLHRLQAALRDQTGRAVTVGYGPRFLHSTGQLHKGGSDTGLFIQLISPTTIDLQIPETAGKPGSFISFGILKLAQAIGDAEALRQAGRRVISFEVPAQPSQLLDKLTDQIKGL